MKYSEIKTMDDLQRAQKYVRSRLDVKKDSVRDSVYGLREAYSPSNMIVSGLRSVSSMVPFEKLLLLAVRSLKNHFLK